MKVSSCPAAVALAAAAVGSATGEIFTILDGAEVANALGKNAPSTLFNSESGFVREPMTQYDTAASHTWASARSAQQGWGKPWDHEPQSVEQAMKTPWWDTCWRPACDKEMLNHAELGTWVLVPITDKPADCKLLPIKMFGKCKRGGR